MGFVDKVLGVMNLGADDEDYEDEFLEEEYEEEEVEERPKLSFRKKNREVEEELPVVTEEEKPKEKAVKAAPKVTPFRTNNRKQANDMGVCVIKPTSVEDAREVTETLLKGRTVVLNMEGVNLDVAQRIIDFTSGSTFAIGGNLQKISGYIFIITPPNVEISGDFADLFSAYETGIHTDI